MIEGIATSSSIQELIIRFTFLGQFWSKNIVAPSAKGIKMIIAINVPKSIPNIALPSPKISLFDIQCIYLIINPSPKAFIAGRKFINNTIPITS